MGFVSLIVDINPLYSIAFTIVFTILASYVKQVILHPLGKYPGPVLARYTSLYAAYHAWKGTLHTDMYECHQRYGSVVRYAPSRLLINTNTAIKDIHAHSANNTKSAVYGALVHGAPNVLTLRRKEEHAWRRRILSLALSDARIASFENMLKGHINNLCYNIEGTIAAAKLQGGENTWLDMSRQSDYFTFDVMSQVIFGMKYNALRAPEYRFVVKALEQSNIRVSAIVQAAFLKVGRLDKYLFPESIRGRNQFLGFITSLLKSRFKMTLESKAKAEAEANNGNAGDEDSNSIIQNGNVFTFLEKAKDPHSDKFLSVQQIRAECATLVVAGSDTSSSTLAATLFYLGNNYLSYKRAAGEVRNAFPSGGTVTMGPQLNKCVYLRACIDEALRLSPPVGGALWREVGPGGMTVDGIHIGEGFDVGTGIYSLHHNEKYHPEPFAYRPERWLAGWTKDGDGQSSSPFRPQSEQVAKEAVELGRSAFVPFSSGPRSCVGKGFAYHELMLTLATLLQRYNFEYKDNATRLSSLKEKKEQNSSTAGMGPGGKGEFLLRDHITGAKNGPLLRFTSRTT